jgi:hypothetical protein
MLKSKIEKKNLITLKALTKMITYISFKKYRWSSNSISSRPKTYFFRENLTCALRTMKHEL